MLNPEDPVTNQEVTMTDHAELCIRYHADQAAYSATVTDRAALRARILSHARQARLSAAWGLRTVTGRRDVTA